MRRLLFVSRDYASDFGSQVSAMHQRMRMLLDAAVASADHVDVLFFVDRRIVAEVGPTRAQESLERSWNLDVSVRVAARSEMLHGPLVQTLRGLLDFRAQEGFFRVGGPAQVKAINDAIASDTDLIVAHRLGVGSAAVRLKTARLPVVMDLDDVEHLKRARGIASRTRPRVRDRLEVAALARGELSTIRACSTALVCSSKDQVYLSKLGATNTTVISNAIGFGDDWAWRRSVRLSQLCFSSELIRTNPTWTLPNFSFAQSFRSGHETDARGATIDRRPIRGKTGELRVPAARSRIHRLCRESG